MVVVEVSDCEDVFDEGPDVSVEVEVVSLVFEDVVGVEEAVLALRDGRSLNA